jgi:hypothetical protein
MDEKPGKHGEGGREGRREGGRARGVAGEGGEVHKEPKDQGGREGVRARHTYVEEEEERIGVPAHLHGPIDHREGPGAEKAEEVKHELPADAEAGGGLTDRV